MDALDQFAAEVDSFAQWAAAGADSGASAARNALLQLTRLYAAALELPPLPSSAADTAPCSERVDDVEWKSVSAKVSRLPFDFYGEVFNPLLLPPDQSLVASLADDIADIYRDVVTGLRQFRAGQREQAHRHWVFFLQIHWGEHVTGAIRALHCWLAANHPSGLSGDA